MLSEIVHTIKRMQSMKGVVRIKNDMRKAFDNVEWPILLRIMGALGFSRRLILLIMQYVSMLDFELLLNRNIMGRVKAAQGFH